jgi:hypothetical protein
MIGIAGAGSSPAWAGGQGDPLLGDLNGDGIADRATLVETAAQCDVQVELGNASGGYGPPTTHSYPKPGTGIAYCPDMGVIVDLGGDGTAELVLAWFAGRPPGVDTDLLVLRDYTPAGGFVAMVDQPSFIGVADFNGDGLTDVYQWTDQGDGFHTYLNTPSSQLVRGPLWISCIDAPNYELADFDGDGATDVVMGYVMYGCPSPLPSIGVVVLLDDGTKVPLQDGDATPGYWTVDVVDADRDGVPDVKTTNLETGEVSHFIGNGDGTFTAAPTAVDDVAHAYRKVNKVIKVLDNDAATSSATLTIVTPPAYGTVTVNSKRQVVYVRTAGHRKTDSFVYQLTDDGKTDTATVTVQIKD